MKFGRLIKDNMRNSFLEMLWKTSLRQFSKEAKLSISLDQQSKVITEVRAIEKYIESKARTTCFYPE